MHSTSHFETPENVRIQYEPAGLGTRFLAWFVDQVLLTVLTVVVIRVLLLMADMGVLSEVIVIQALNFLLMLAMINLILAIFNMIPVPPLDGHYLLNYFLPPEGQRVMQQIGPMGILIAILVARPVLSFVFPPLYGIVLAASGLRG